MHLDFSRKSLLKCIRRILPNNQLCERWRPEYRQCGLPDRFHSPCTADFLKQGNEDLEKSLSPLHWKLNNKYPWSQRDGEGGAGRGRATVQSTACWTAELCLPNIKVGRRDPQTLSLPQPLTYPVLPILALGPQGLTSLFHDFQFMSVSSSNSRPLGHLSYFLLEAP